MNWWSQKLKVLSMVAFVLIFIGSVVYAVVLFGNGLILMGLLALVGGIFAGCCLLAMAMTLVELSEKIDSIGASLWQQEHEKAADREPGPNEWKCQKCGKINKNHTGTCACGQSKLANK